VPKSEFLSAQIGHCQAKNVQVIAAADLYVSSLREAVSLCIEAVSRGSAKPRATRDSEAGATAA